MRLRLAISSGASLHLGKHGLLCRNPTPSWLVCPRWPPHPCCLRQPLPASCRPAFSCTVNLVFQSNNTITFANTKLARRSPNQRTTRTPLSRNFTGGVVLVAHHRGASLGSAAANNASCCWHRRCPRLPPVSIRRSAKSNRILRTMLGASCTQPARHSWHRLAGDPFEPTLISVSRQRLRSPGRRSLAVDPRNAGTCNVDRQPGRTPIGGNLSAGNIQPRATRNRGILPRLLVASLQPTCGALRASPSGKHLTPAFRRKSRASAKPPKIDFETFDPPDDRDIGRPFPKAGNAILSSRSPLTSSTNVPRKHGTREHGCRDALRHPDAVSRNPDYGGRGSKRGSRSPTIRVRVL